MPKSAEGVEHFFIDWFMKDVFKYQFDMHMGKPDLCFPYFRWPFLLITICNIDKIYFLYLFLKVY